MIDPELHPYVEWIAREARRPVLTDAAARERVMAAIRPIAPPRRSRARGTWGRLLEPRALTLSPLTSALLAAGLVGIGVLAGVLAQNRDGRAPVGQRPVAAVPQLPVSDTIVKFVFFAPQASEVAVVGDFNDWDTTKTPMERAAKGGLWTVAMPLTPGRHLYSFVVDGTIWTTDPGAPVAPDDGFGRANSVKIVRGRAARGRAL
jgi:hypothetical protein